MLIRVRVPIARLVGLLLAGAGVATALYGAVTNAALPMYGGGALALLGWLLDMAPVRRRLLRLGAGYVDRELDRLALDGLIGTNEWRFADGPPLRLYLDQASGVLYSRHRARSGQGSYERVYGRASDPGWWMLPLADRAAPAIREAMARPYRWIEVRR